MLGDQCRELADDLPVSSEREIGVEPIFERTEPEVVEPAQLVTRERLRFEFRQRPPTPQGQRRAKPLRPHLHLQDLTRFGE